jgi:hypothetical protein
VRPLLLFCAALAGPSVAAAQVGVLDQVSPIPGAGQQASFAVSSPSMVWQQQLRADVAGTLTAIEVELSGPATARALLRVRPSAGWSTAPPVHQVWLQKSQSGAQRYVVDVRGAELAVARGQAFVVELSGDGSLAGVNGSYTPSSSGAPQYPEPLFLSGPGCYASCGWRIGVRTWVQDGDLTEYCFGTGCPCGNDASAGGCANSTGHGARLAQSGGTTSVASDDLVLGVTHLPPYAPTLLFMGATQTRVPFGDGLRCAGGTPVRLRLAIADAHGVASFARVVTLARGLALPGSTWHLQAWHRDAAGPCGASYGQSSALQALFRP